jgi:hypothetical protein
MDEVMNDDDLSSVWQAPPTVTEVPLRLACPPLCFLEGLQQGQQIQDVTYSFAACALDFCIAQKFRIFFIRNPLHDSSRFTLPCNGGRLRHQSPNDYKP